MFVFCLVLIYFYSMAKKLNSAVSSSLIIASVAFRLLPHFPNFTPLGATAIFTGSRGSRPWNYYLPILILFMTDMFLGFHKTMLFVYASFLITTFLAEKFLKNKSSIIGAGTLGLVNSVIFFLITNYGVWLTTNLYPKTLSGLMESYLMGVPFLRNMAMADVAFTVGVFAVYQATERYFSVRKLKLEGVS